ncbi:MAG: 50S ribosomal protein L15 [Longimicrobiales bacterium]
MSDLSNLSRPEGAHRNPKRIGRGPGSGTGKTSGKGHKGQKARTGHHGTPSWFEGGQMPLQRRLPKRGFTPLSRTTFTIINVDDLQRLEETEVTPQVLVQHRLAGKNDKVKVLGEGSLDRKVTVRAHAFSAGARTKIEAAGGTAELLES